MAVIGIVINTGERIDSGEKSLFAALLNQISFAIEKFLLNESQKKALMQAENERFRANLLRAVSHDLRTEPQLVEEIINEALQHVNRKSVEYKINVNLQNELLMVNVDVRLIVQVIINIVDNAIKYTDEGSEITINAFVRSKKVVIEIADNGSGISEQDKKCIFDMFFTVNGNRGDNRRGLGLGLALCKSIINAHGGKIYVKDNKPKGTIMGFTLDLVEVKNNENINFSSRG